MNEAPKLKLLFIINEGSGNDTTNWPQVIQDYFSSLHHNIELFTMPKPCDTQKIKDKINVYKPDKVIAVGGDGTVKLVAQAVIKTGMPLGILPAGSANGMAKELDIPNNAKEALDIIVNGVIKKIHLVKINDEICIHLSDIGFNAFVVKKFENESTRGMWGYIKATWKVLWNQPYMVVTIKTDTTTAGRNAAMIVIANANKYGTGALINPDGKLDDDLFEIIVVKKISAKEIFKMVVTHMPYDPTKTEVFQTSSLQITSKKKAHFQVDGEYLGKIDRITAEIIPQAVDVIVPEERLTKDAK